jgi:uncharacterized protein YcbX
LQLRVGALHVYPLKGGRAVSLTGAVIGARGIEHDRRLLLVDERRHFITQREHPALARIRVTIGAETLTFAHDDGGPLHVPLRPEGGDARRVVIWGDACEALSLGDEAARWFSDRLGARCELVYMPDSSRRQVDPDYARVGDLVSFADGFPILVTSTASLDDLNERLAQPVPMNRFRPNVVVDGGVAWQEDGWRRVHVGSVDVRIAKPCARCVVTTVDLETGEGGREPMKTLAAIRSFGGKVLFGQNAIPDAPGVISVGDVVEVLESA